MKLPICQAPIWIKRDPTVWLSTEAARDWIARTIRRLAVDMTLEEALEEHDKTFGSKVRVHSLACPAGDPCPATGCPACCPSYDPCGEKNCRSCNPKEGDMHVPEEANLAKKLTADDIDEAVYGDKSEAGVEEVLPHVVKMVTDKIREAYANGNGPENILAFKILELQELCNLAVQAEYQRSGVVEDALRRVLAEGRRREVTDKDRELIAKNAKATIERRDAERAKKLMRETAMHHAVELHKAGLRAGNIPTKSITQSADDILEWLKRS